MWDNQKKLGTLDYRLLRGIVELLMLQCVSNDKHDVIVANDVGQFISPFFSAQKQAVHTIFKTAISSIYACNHTLTIYSGVFLAPLPTIAAVISHNPYVHR